MPALLAPLIPLLLQFAPVLVPLLKAILGAIMEGVQDHAEFSQPTGGDAALYDRLHHTIGVWNQHDPAQKAGRAYGSRAQGNEWLCARFQRQAR